MRLIDADALKEELIKAKEENEKEHMVLIDNDFMTLIHDAPTIEAPVVAEIKIDTDALIERIKKEYDIVE